MSETETSAHPVPPTPVGPPPAYAPPAYGPGGEPRFAAPGGQAGFGAPPARTRWRDVVFGWRSAVVLFVAGIVLGGLGGAAITVVADHHGNNDAPTIGRYPGGGFGEGFGSSNGGRPGTQGGQTGQSGQAGQSDDGSGTTGGFLGGEAG